MQFVKILLQHPETDVNEEDANGDNAATYALKNKWIERREAVESIVNNVFSLTLLLSKNLY